MIEDTCTNWLVGGNPESNDGLHTIQGPGLYAGSPDDEWVRLGHNQASVFALLRQPGRVLMGADHGLWSWDRMKSGWVQYHDETLTEVLSIAALPGEPGVLAGCPYGVARARRDEPGVTRWNFLSEPLSPDERYTNALLVDPNDPGHWVAGTEAGIILYTQDGAQTTRGDLFDSPVRALFYTQDRFWAGTDDRGIFSSQDGLHWVAAGEGVEGAVYAIASAGTKLVAATPYGLVVGDGAGPWQRCGPRMLFVTVAVDPADPTRWMAGASPGGLWHTQDAGQSWRQIDTYKHVRAVLAPEGQD